MSCSCGNAAKTPPKPRPTATTMAKKPSATPTRCGTLARKPKLAPEAISMVLLGPGVIDETKAKSASAPSNWGLSEVMICEDMAGLPGEGRPAPEEDHRYLGNPARRRE